MKKIFKFFIFVVIGFTAFASSFAVNAVEEENLVIINPGENASTEMNISYHTKNKDSMVIYYATGYYKGQKISEEGPKMYAQTECVSIPFEFKDVVYQCKATLDNLIPAMEYNYSIMGSSVERSFVTAGDNGFSFVHVTDIHSYFFGANNTRVAAANKVLNTINEIRDFDFVLASGDVTAYGTVYEQWESLYQMDVLQNKMLAQTPGNHDYYNQGAAVTHIGYFNAVNNNPMNGATGIKNASYYFKYGNALFVSLDSEAASGNTTLRQNQIEWLNEVTANNPADFIIAFTHRPFYTGDSGNAGQARDMRSYFQEIFDNTGVDLVLSGHNHVYARTYQIYDNEIVDGDSLGTTYLTGIQIGDRYKTEPGTKMSQVEIAHLGANQDGGSLISVLEDRITIEFIRHDGEKMYPYVIHSKSSQIDEARIEESLIITKEEDDTTIEYDFINPGIIKKIDIYDIDGDLIHEELNPTGEAINLKELPKVALYELNVELLLRNNEVISKSLLLNDERFHPGELEIIEEEFETILSWENELSDDLVSHYEIFVNGEILKGADKNLTETVLDMVSPYQRNLIGFKVIGRDKSVLYNYEFYYGEDSTPLEIELEKEKYLVVVGSDKQIEFTTNLDEEIKVIYTSSDESIATVDENGVITGISEGSCIITIEVPKRWEATQTIEIEVSEAGAYPKTGCRFGAAHLFTGLSVLGFVFILRRRNIY